MDIKSLFREKVESSINQMSVGEKVAKEAKLRAIKIADEAVTMVLNAAGQLSREIAPYKSGISFKRRYDKINNDIIISPKYYQSIEGRESYLYIDLSRIHSIEEAESVINNMMHWCAEHVAYSKSEPARAIKYRHKRDLILCCILSGVATVLMLYYYLTHSSPK